MIAESMQDILRWIKYDYRCMGDVVGRTVSDGGFAAAELRKIVYFILY